MALVEMWWGSTEFGNTEGMRVELGPAGYSLQGNLNNQNPLIITAHYFISQQRMNFGTARCVSQPVAVFSGSVKASTTGSLIGDGDPRIAVKHVLRQRAYLAGKQVAQSDREVEVVDVKGDNKSKTATLSALAFDPLTFGAVPGSELRIDLIVELDPWYHKTRIGGASYQGLLQLPQWGIISGISG